MKEYALRLDKNGEGDIVYSGIKSIVLDENNLNPIFIKLFSNRDYWGNRLLSKKDQVGSNFYLLQNEAITPKYLERVEQVVTAALMELKGVTSLDNATVKASISEPDQIFIDIKITDIYGTEQGIVIEDVNLWKQ